MTDELHDLTVLRFDWIVLHTEQLLCRELDPSDNDYSNGSDCFLPIPFADAAIFILGETRILVAFPRYRMALGCRPAVPSGVCILPDSPFFGVRLRAGSILRATCSVNLDWNEVPTVASAARRDAERNIAHLLPNRGHFACFDRFQPLWLITS